jgi:hypothetical protein
MSFTYHKILLFVLVIFLIMPVFPAFSLDDWAETSVTVVLVCGDGFTDPGEACDPGDVDRGIAPDYGTTTCSAFGYMDGKIKCADDCSAFLTDQCNTCGNNAKEGDEQCDGNDLDNKTCQSFGYTNGSISCISASPLFPGQSPPGCIFNLSGCYSVGLDVPGPGGTGVGGGGGGGGSGGGGIGSPVGQIPGSDVAPGKTRVIITGKSYPDADVHVLVDGKVIGIVKADSKADYYFETSEVTPGLVGFGLWSEDKLGIKSTLLTLTLRVITGAITTISGAYISPTIDIEKKQVKKGETVKLFGQTVPTSEVHVHINSDEEIVSQTNSQDDGTWTLDFDSSHLAEDFHTAKALFQTPGKGMVIKSGFSRSVSFYVGEGIKEEGIIADLNDDKRVNLTDFSILLYNWGKSGVKADVNKNGKVDLSDFSIMMFYWTG